MKHPDYPLRPNKAVDRFMLIEVIRRLERVYNICEYTYYGLGGPFLEDFRLLYELCPNVGMVSIEGDEQTYRRQEFHLPCGSLKLECKSAKSFLKSYEARDCKSIFWLDYTGLEYGAFNDFTTLLDKVADNSVIKVTLRAEPRDYWDPDADPKKDALKRKDFVEQFVKLLPTPTTEPPNDFESFAALLQEMLQIAAQKALPSGVGRIIQPVCSFCYKDSVGMFTFTGIVCPQEESSKIKRMFSNWHFCNLNWRKPKRIDVPFLTTKERLHLQKFLPCDRGAGRKLHKALGYIIDADRKTSAAKMSQYADFHRYYPFFVKATP